MIKTLGIIFTSIFICNVYAVTNISLTPFSKPVKNVKVLELKGSKKIAEGKVHLGLNLRPFVNGKYDDFKWIYFSGKNISLHFDAKPKVKIKKYNLTVWNLFNQPIYSKMFPGDISHEVINFDVKGKGTYLITIDAWENDDPESSKSRLIRSFGVVNNNAPKQKVWREKNDYLLGTAMFGPRYYRWKRWNMNQNMDVEYLTPKDVIKKIGAVTRTLGMTAMRSDLDIVHHNFPGITRENFDNLHANKLAFFLKIIIKPDIFIGKTTKFNKEKYLAFQKKLDFWIDNYLRSGKNIAMVAVGNEPAHHEFWAGTFDQYLVLLKLIRAKVKKANPNIIIVGGGTCLPGANLNGERARNYQSYLKKRAFQKKWYERYFREAAKYTDIHTYHFHGKLDDIYFNWRKWEDEQLKKNKLNISSMQTEGGACAWRLDLESPTWMNLLQKIFYSWGRGDSGWYQYLMAGTRFSERIHMNTGLHTGWDMVSANNFSPKFIYGTMSAVIDIFAGCKRDKTLFVEKDGEIRYYAYSFKHPEGLMLVHFAAPVTDKKLSKSISFNTDAEELVFIDPMGNITKTSKIKKQTLPVKNYPSYILLKGASKVEAVLK